MLAAGGRQNLWSRRAQALKRRRKWNSTWRWSAKDQTAASRSQSTPTRSRFVVAALYERRKINATVIDRRYRFNGRLADPSLPVFDPLQLIRRIRSSLLLGLGRTRSCSRG